uniref:Uncharacterized protein n=1 Tax=Amphimedon queenslandica TaxID=400682 RepID=A0A1X7TFH1_AMPQE
MASNHKPTRWLQLDFVFHFVLCPRFF